AITGLAMTLHAAAPQAVTITITKAGSPSFASAPAAGDSTTQPAEIDEALSADADAANGAGADDEQGVNRTLPGVMTGHGRAISTHSRAKSNPQLGTHFQGLNFHDQRFANGGNQFSVEPPDQALCAG